MKSYDEEVARFWASVEKTDTCWWWMKRVRRMGPKQRSSLYGQTKFMGRQWQTHRLAYELAYGVIPDGLEVCHRCDHPGCVRPDHLFLGTHAENIQDMYAKGRGYKGLYGKKDRG